jgi:shikimate kinase
MAILRQFNYLQGRPQRQRCEAAGKAAIWTKGTVLHRENASYGGNTEFMEAKEALKLPKPLVLVGLMGAGKSAVGRRLAARLDVPFIDADAEIEKAAGCTISEIFERDGESGFRAGERRVVARLLSTEPVHILATGGGAFMDPETRALIREKAISLWLRADLEVLFERVSRRSHRPLLKTADPKGTLAALMAKRYPVYAEANIVVDSADGPINAMIDKVMDALRDYLKEGESV